MFHLVGGLKCSCFQPSLGFVMLTQKIFGHTGLFDNSIPVIPWSIIVHIKSWHFGYASNYTNYTVYRVFGQTPFLLFLLVGFPRVEQAHKDVITINSTLSACERSAEWQRVLHFFAKQRPGN